jgi:catechol 2,3-dioxygenase-like lactoylglutathione lyase family enzyme
VSQEQHDLMLATAPAIAFVPSTDLARSRAFYEGVLGLPVLSEDAFAVVVRAGTGTIRITNVGAELRAQPFTVLGWAVAALDTEIAELGGRGVEFLEFPGMDQDAQRVWTAPGGTRVAWFHDPDGNTLSLSQH